MEIKKRLDWLDAAKAIGVYLVILGHLVIFNYHTFRFIFAFHMPFFFMAAGYVWKKPEHFNVFLKKCCKYYLVPYLTVIMIGLLQCVLFPLPGHNLQTLCNPEILERSFYGGLPAYSYFGSSWFLIAMFWAQLLFYGMMKINEKLKKYIVILLWICFVLFAVFAKDIVCVVPFFERLPLKTDSALMATVFMGIGVLLKKTTVFEKRKWYLAMVFAVVGAFITWLFGCKWNYYVNICDLEYAKEYNYFIAAIGGTVMLFGLGYLLKKNKVILFIGKNTLFIFLAHQAVYELVIYCVNKLCNRNLYGQSMPLNGWSIGISIATFVICTLLAWGYQKLKKLFFKIKNTKGGTAHEENQRIDTLL